MNEDICPIMKSTKWNISLWTTRSILSFVFIVSFLNVTIIFVKVDQVQHSSEEHHLPPSGRNASTLGSSLPVVVDTQASLHSNLTLPSKATDSVLQQKAPIDSEIDNGSPILNEANLPTLTPTKRQSTRPTQVPSARPSLRSIIHDSSTKLTTTAINHTKTPLQHMLKFVLDSNILGQPPQTKGAFIHVGKAAGSTISSLLRNGCHTFLPKPCRNETELPSASESAISKLTTYFHTPDFEEKNLQKYHEENQYQFFVLTIRDPLSRSISSYAASHPMHVGEEKMKFWKETAPGYHKWIWNKAPNNLTAQVTFLRKAGLIDLRNSQMYECFETLDEYAKLLSNFSAYDGSVWWYNQLRQKDCASVAKSTLHHAPGPVTHSLWDLRNILLQLQDGKLKEKAILLIRQEFIWNDWSTANSWVGDENIKRMNKTLIVRNSTELEIKLDMTLSEDGRKHLCHALVDEFKVYLKLIEMSVNLSEDEKMRSLEIARGNCPWLALEFSMDDTEESFEVRGEILQF